MNRKGFVKIIIIGVIVIITIAAGYFAMTRKTAEAPATIQETESTQDWKTYRNEELGFEVRYPANIFQLDKSTSVLSHTLKNFHEYNMKDGSDLGLAQDIKIVFKKEDDRGCDWLEMELGLNSIGVPFEFKNISGIKYETGAEGGGVIDHCVKNKDGKNIFLIERWFLSDHYSTDLLKQNDYIDSKKQEEIFNQVLSTFEFINKEVIEQDIWGKISTSKTEQDAWRGLYTSKELGISFKSHSFPGNVVYSYNDYKPGDTAEGIVFRWRTGRKDIYGGWTYTFAGGVSSDFGEGRSRWITDTYKWGKERDKYYRYGPRGVRFEIIPLRIVNHPVGVEGVIYEAKLTTPDGELINPKGVDRAATLNFPENYHPELKSITFYFYDETSLDDIEKVLKSVSFQNN